MFRSVVFGVMALIIFRQIMLNCNIFNHFKVKKMPTNDKNKTLVKLNWKRLFSVFFFV